MSVIREIYDVMSQRPQEIALTEEDLEWTYDDLRRRSDLVAGSLASHGIARGGVVGMHLPRCADAIAVMLGIMASGCVYLPLDPTYPPARLRLMLDRAGAVAVISNSADEDLYGSQLTWLPSPSLLGGEPEVPASELAIYSAEKEPFGPQDLAYILFTSGSTGEPKGVMVTHENLALMNEWSARVLGVTASDASATTCSLSFDASFHETLLPLSAGGTVHVVPHALALGQLAREVSLVATTPTVASELLRAGHLPRLKVLMLGGEALTPDVAERILSSGRVGTLLNCYGPTECTVCVTLAEVSAPVPEVIPIGRQVPGTEVLILDENGQQVPDGELGEICVFGGQVTIGYVNDPGGTAERFVVSLGTAGEPKRYYRTGDLGYRLRGLIYFAGRADKQVKLNGIRIELGEIEAALRSYSQVSDAAAVVRQEGRAVAYVVPAQAGADVDIADLKKHVARSLPRFMLPAGIVVVAELPTSVSGKLDVSALPAWSPSRLEDESRGGAGEADELTSRVMHIVADLTGFAGQIRLSDDFIDDLGGTSLGVLQVLVELERWSGRRLRLSDALADTSVAGFARLLHAEEAPCPADFSFNSDGGTSPLFLIHSYLGGMLGLRRIAELLPAGQPVYGLHVDCGTEEFGDSVTISSFARNALSRMREIQPAGQITMAGHSAGALIVFEAGRQSLDAGDPEPRVLLMDSPWPHSAFEYYWGEALLQWRDLIRDPFGVARAIAAKAFRAAVAREGSPPPASPADDLMTLTDRRKKSVDDAVKAYRAQAYQGRVTIMRTRQGRVMALGRRYLGWAAVTRGVPKVIDVPGAHVSMLREPNARTVAERLVEWLSADRSGTAD